MLFRSPADKKAPIEAALQKLKDAHKAQDIAACEAAEKELETAFQTASAEMYAQSGAQQGPQGGADYSQYTGGQNGGSQQDNAGKQDENIQDADFEEVK